MKSNMKRITAALLLLAMFIPLLPLKADAQVTEDERLKLLTDSYKSGSGSFTLTDTARLFVVSNAEPTGELLQTAQLINSEFAAAGLPTSQPLSLVWGNSQWALPGDIVLELVSGLGADGYRLTITSDRLTVSASDVDGLLNGAFMAIRHFQVYRGLEIPACTIKDEPDTKERTLMLDCARKYWTVEWIKNLIRQMSWMGYNTLELHMTEDQGIRANIWRDANGNTVPDSNGNDFSWLPGYKAIKWASDDGNGQGVTSGVQDPNAAKFYNRDELIEILDCAKEYHIDVIPGIDVPGHCDYFIYQWDNSGASSYFTYNYKGTTYSDRPSQIYIDGSDLYPDDDYKAYGTLDYTNPYTKYMSMALIDAYADFFRTYGNSTKINIGCDEIRGDIDYSAFVSYVNEICADMKAQGYTVRAFNDYLYRSSDTLDPDLEICYWKTTSYTIPATDTSEKQTIVIPPSTYINDERTIYNCVNNYTYYVLRYRNGYGEARDPDCLAWGFHHSTEDRIYSGCGGNCKKDYSNPCYSTSGWNPSKLCCVTDSSEYYYSGSQLGGGYFLIWGDWGGWRTEAQVWNGEDGSDTYNLIDRMWSNIVKMWNWDIDNSLPYNSNYQTLRDLYRIYPGYTSPSADPSIPAAASLQKAVDFTALQALIAQEPKLSKDEYTTESYAAYETALASAQSVCDNINATQSQVDEALAALKTAYNGLKALTARVIYKTMVGTEEETIEETEVDGGELSMELRARRGYRFLRIEGNATFQPLYSGAEGGALRGTVTIAEPIVIWYENLPQLEVLERLLSADDAALTEENAEYAAQKQLAQDFYNSVMGAPGEKTTQAAVDGYVDRLIAARSRAVLAASQTEIINIRKTTDYVAAGKSAVLIVTTSTDVSSVTVEGVTLDECQGKLSVTDSGKQVKLWYLSFEMTTVGTTTYTVTAVGGSTVTETIKIICQ